jgi:hypothetical protein
MQIAMHAVCGERKAVWHVACYDIADRDKKAAPAGLFIALRLPYIGLAVGGILSWRLWR